MSEQMQFLLIGVVGVAMLVLFHRWQVIGVHAGTVNRTSNPIAYWIAMTVLAFGTVVSLLLATGLF